jgi:hypothetical protein
VWWGRTGGAATPVNPCGKVGTINILYDNMVLNKGSIIEANKWKFDKLFF